jgi:hypothetical protein
MSLFQQHKDFYNSPVLLSEDQKKEPLKVITAFFSYAHLHQAREILADLLHTALISDNSEFDSGSKRDGIILFCKEVEQLIEAAYLINSDNTKS